MRFPTFFLCLLMSCSILVNLQAQDKFSHVEGDILVRVKYQHVPHWISTDLAYHKGYQTQIEARELLSKHMNIWRFRFNKDVISHDAMLSLIKQHASVHNAQLNFIMEKRVVPNDANYTQQWQYEQSSDNDLDAEAAWDITTGGVTALGDTIVVCVIDDGLQVSHPDWGDNIWYNHGEIPGNGIDDDNNGYIDDFRGWNADNNNDNIVASGPFTSHGTPVAGIVAAKGNNGVGVSGVNWNVKLMFVVGGGSNADALAAYDYPLSCRKLYNQTNGAQGAYVVATNASWGVDNQQCATYAPLVNELYDTLGVYGVLNCAATANANTNVDIQGDFPTSCDSDYLIAVTNMNQSGAKETQAGYGSTHIDLGAFGAGTYTLATNSSYGGFGGTSGATPHVAGTIGLLYSAPCPRFAQMAKNDPQQTALMVKNILLNSSVPNSTLTGITVSEGVLNMKNALDSLMDIGCSLSGCHEPYNSALISADGNNATLHWDAVDSTTLYYTRYRPIGGNWVLISVPDTFVNIAGLIACSDYEFQVAANCDSTVYSSVFSFKTGDCCNAPSSINLDSSGINFASFSWAADSFVNQYIVEYKLQSASVWSSDSTTNGNLLLSNLDSCSLYEMRIISSCPVNVNNLYSSIIDFETDGCGNCTSTDYCASTGANSVDDWIENVTLENINNTTGDDGGYISFVNGGPTTDLTQGGTYPFSIEIGFNTGPWATNWKLKAWIDFNQDELLDDATELVYDAGQISTSTTVHTGTINIPASADLSRTRLRVALKWGTNNLGPCDNSNYGETEDYCVNIVTPTNKNTIKPNQQRIEAFPNPFENSLNFSIFSQQEQGVTVLFSTLAGQRFYEASKTVYAGENSFKLPSNTLPKGLYLISVIFEDGTILNKKVIKN